MNLSPLNGGVMHQQTSHQDPPSDQSSMCFEQHHQYHTPLVSSYYSNNTYSTIHNDSPSKSGYIFYQYNAY